MKAFFPGMIYIRQNIKHHIRSLWMVMMTVPVLLITLLIVAARFNSVFTFADFMYGFGYYNMFMGFVYCSYGGYLSFSTDEFDYSLFSKPKVMLLRIISGFLFSLISVLLMFVISGVIACITGISGSLFVHFTFYVFLKCLAQIAVLFSVGFTLGCLIKGRWVYIVTSAAAFLFSPVFDVAMNSDIGSRFLRNFFNLSFENPNYPQFAAAGKLNQFFLLKSLFWIVVAVVLVLFVLLLTCNINLKPFLTAAPVVTVCMVTIFHACMTAYPTTLFFNADGRLFFQTNLDHEEKINLYENEGTTLDYAITQMDMDLYLGEQIKNECRITIRKSQTTSFIRLKLDEVFNATAYLSGKDPVLDGSMMQARDDDYLYIYTPYELYPEDTLKITISYEGRLNYQNSLYSKTFYSTEESSCLHHQFAWYPQIVENNDPIDFKVTVHANNPFVSNLTGGKLITDRVYTANASLKQVYLLSGYFTEMTVDGYNCVLFEGFRSAPKAVENSVKQIVSLIRDVEVSTENSKQYRLSVYDGGGYSQPYHLSSIRTIIYCPFSFHGFTLFGQYESTFFVNELI